VGSDFTETTEDYLCYVLLQITQTQLHSDTSTTLHYDHFWRWRVALRRSQCLQITPCIVWQVGNSARKGQVSTRFLGYPQYFEMNNATLHSSPILRRHSMGTWFSVVTTIGYKWVYNVGSPPIIYSIQTQHEWQGRSGGAYSIFPCWQACGSVDNLRAILQCSRVSAAIQSFAVVTLQRRRYALCTTSGRTPSRVIWQLSVHVLTVGLIGLS